MPELAGRVPLTAQVVLERLLCQTGSQLRLLLLLGYYLQFQEVFTRCSGGAKQDLQRVSVGFQEGLEDFHKVFIISKDYAPLLQSPVAQKWKAEGSC